MKIYIISGKTNRISSLKNELQKQDIIEYNLVDGIFNDDIPFKNISLAHKNCISNALNLSLETVCIMEDDIMFAWT